jgi:hypothetical protein
MSPDEYQLMLALRRELEGDEAAEVDPWNPQDKHPHSIPPSLVSLSVTYLLSLNKQRKREFDRASIPSSELSHY